VTGTVNRIQSIEADLDAALGLRASGKVLFAALGIIVSLTCLGSVAGLAVHGYTAQESGDFLAYYSGAKLAWTGHLYDAASVQSEQVRAIGVSAPALQFVRLPFYAVLLSPLGLLPFPAAFAIWQSCSLLAAAGSLMLWRGMARSWLAICYCWSMPLASGFIAGQDTTFLLLVVVVCLRTFRAWPFATGMLASLLAIKFHLFLLWPLLLIAQRRRRLAAGFACGAAALAGLSFAAAGPHWITEYWNVIRKPAVSPADQLMPNLNGLLHALPHGVWIEAAAAIGIAVLSWRALRRTGFADGLAVMLAGGLLISHHAYTGDGLLLLPALLILIQEHWGTWAGYVCLALLTPAPFWLLSLGTWPGNLTRALLVVLFGIAALKAPARDGQPRKACPAQCGN
jgi:hypothetical protein